MEELDAGLPPRGAQVVHLLGVVHDCVLGAIVWHTVRDDDDVDGLDVRTVLGRFLQLREVGLEDVVEAQAREGKTVRGDLAEDLLNLSLARQVGVATTRFIGRSLLRIVIQEVQVNTVLVPLGAHLGDLAQDRAGLRPQSPKHAPRIVDKEYGVKLSEEGILVIVVEHSVRNVAGARNDRVDGGRSARIEVIHRSVGWSVNIDGWSRGSGRVGWWRTIGGVVRGWTGHVGWREGVEVVRWRSLGARSRSRRLLGGGWADILLLLEEFAECFMHGWSCFGGCG